MSARRKGPSVGGRATATIIDGPRARRLREEPAMHDGTPTLQDAAPTLVDPPRPAIQVISKMDRSGPIQVISMKTQAPAAGKLGAQAQQAQHQAQPSTPVLPRPKLRAVSDITPVKQQNLGHVAPPYDPEQARARRLREYVIGGCVAVMLASAIALVVWFVAR